MRTQTFSKGYKYFPIGIAPQYIDRGKGAYIWDVDNNRFTDYIMSLCPITLGYHYPAVDRAIKKQLDKGIIFSLSSPLEIELSELLRDIIPCAEMTRFFKTGSEATQAAIRLARAYTNREDIAYCGYHGWHSWYACTTDRDKGTLPIEKQLMHKFEYNNIESLEKILDEFACAAIIMEPIVSHMPTNNFLQKVRELATKHKAVLIFDEIVTGFRIDLHGAQGYFGVTPDLATFGKGMANGMPLNCIVGKKELMNEFENVMVSGTFCGELLSIAASIATIHEMIKRNVVLHFRDIGMNLRSGLMTLGLNVNGYPARFIYDLPDNSPEVRTLFMQEMIERGQLIHPTLALNLCYSHTMNDINRFLDSFNESLLNVRRAITVGNTKELLYGDAIEMAFRRTD